MQNFINKFLTSEEELGENSSYLQMLMLQFYHSLTRDSMHALYIYIELLNSFYRVMISPEFYDISQLKLMQTIVRHRPHDVVLSSEHLNALLKLAETYLERQIVEFAEPLRMVLREPNIKCLADEEDREKMRSIAALIQFFGIPFNVTNDIVVDENHVNNSYLSLILAMRKLNYSTEMTVLVAKILIAGHPRGIYL